MPLLAALAGGDWWAMSNGSSNVAPAERPKQEEKPKVVEPKAGQTGQNPTDKLTYVWIPAGKFDMGCSEGDKECSNDEPVRRDVVIQQGFWIGQTEVTQAAYQRVIGADPSRFKGADLPIETVSWEAKIGAGPSSSIPMTFRKTFASGSIPSTPGGGQILSRRRREVTGGGALGVPSAGREPGRALWASG